MDIIGTAQTQTGPRLMNVDDLSKTAKSTKILLERIICIELGHLKNRTFFALTDCGSRSNFRQGGTERQRGGRTELNINLVMLHVTATFTDTCGAKEGRGAETALGTETQLCRE